MARKTSGENSTLRGFFNSLVHGKCDERDCGKERPQGSFGTQRNTMDGVNVYVFAKEHYLRRNLIYQVHRYSGNSR